MGTNRQQAYRKPDEIKPNDVMRLDDLVSKPELNGLFVTVLREQPHERWGVLCMDVKQTQISVKP